MMEMMIYQQMVDVSQDIIDKIHQHPFNQELAMGTLSQEKFIYYLVQDSLYLAEFSRALAITAGRLHHPLHRQQFIHFTLGAIQAEQELHKNYLNTCYLKYNASNKYEQSPSCFMYTNFLLNMAALSSVEEALASLLPCFVIYQQVGKSMLEKLYANHPYHDWIALYAGEAFESSTRAAIDIVNLSGQSSGFELQQKMLAAFKRSVQLEWNFWQGAWQQDIWLV